MAKGHARPRGNGKWQLEVDLGSYTDINGKRRRNKKYKTIDAKGQRYADEQLIQFVAKVTGKGYFEPQKINFVDFVYNEWLPKCAKRRLAHTTLERHIYYLELRILPAFQHLRLDQIKPAHIINFLQNLEEKGMRSDGKELASSTIFYHYRISSSSALVKSLDTFLFCINREKCIE